MKPDKIKTVLGMHMAVNTNTSAQYVSMSLIDLIIMNNGIMATLRGSIIPPRKIMLIAVLKRYLYREIPNEAIDPIRITNTMVPAVMRRLFSMYRSNPPIPHTL
jgi:hypothetical protein